MNNFIIISVIEHNSTMYVSNSYKNAIKLITQLYKDTKEDLDLEYLCLVDNEDSSITHDWYEWDDVAEYLSGLGVLV